MGSYPTEDVTFLLKDLGGLDIERGTEEREELIQTGTHYAEMLPVEYQPAPAYVELFEQALARSARRLAVAVGVVTEQILATKPDAVLVSLARAGTPIGVLLRRWALRSGHELPHYSVSIVRGRGIDQVAMRWLLARERSAASSPPRSVRWGSTTGWPCSPTPASAPPSSGRGTTSSSRVPA
jgi:hypothetical protein